MATPSTFFPQAEPHPLLPVLLREEDRVNNGIDCLSYGSFYVLPFMGCLIGSIVGYEMSQLMPPILTGLLISGGSALEWVVFMALLGVVLGFIAHHHFCSQEDEFDERVAAEPLGISLSY